MPYNLNNAVITIRDLRLRTYIGFNPEELTKQQDVVINASIEYKANIPVGTDSENDALNYKVITKRYIQIVESGRFHLLEKLTGDLIETTMEHEDVLKCEITVDKPHALRFADSVSLTLVATRPHP